MRRAACYALALALTLAADAADSVGSLSLEVSPREATVGDPLQVRVALELPSASALTPPDLGDAFGPFSVLAGAWQGPLATAGRNAWTWTGTIAAYEPGTLQVPALHVAVPGAGGATELSTEPVSITIGSVLGAEQAAAPGGEAKAPDLADLKPAASIAPDYGPLRKALAVLAALLLAAALAWALHRRYARRLSAVPAPADPFRRLPPHAWAYEELQRLLERRLAEEGKVEEFFAELSRILKLYLSGRYRVELMERTTDEVLPALRQAGAPQGPLASAKALLERSDLVKFARRTLLPEDCRSAIEEAYRIVDATKPVEEAAPRGAARDVA